jgi:hypothetical protein
MRSWKRGMRVDILPLPFRSLSRCLVDRIVRTEGGGEKLNWDPPPQRFEIL